MFFRNSYFAKIYAETVKYFDELNKYEEEAARIDQTYAESVKEQRRQENEATKPDQEKTVKRFQEYRDLLFKQLYETELDSKNLTPDFEFLKLSAILSYDEVMTLYEKNIKNPLFTRTLKKYCEDNKIFVPIEDGTAKLKGEIDDFVGKHMRFVDFTVNGVYLGKTLWENTTDADYAEWRSWDMGE